MSVFKQLIITDRGQALMAKMIAGASNIKFTKISVSDKTYNDSQLQTLTSLESIKQSTSISKVVRNNNVSVQIEGALTNSELTSGYYMRAVGLYATDPDLGEILYAVTIASQASYMPPYNGITVSGAYFKLITTVSNSESVNINVDPAGVATIGDIREIEIKIDEDISNLGVLVGELFHQANALKKEQEKNISQRQQQGVIYIYNKYVKDGCKLSKMTNSRYVEVSRGDSYTEGDMSIVYVDGKLIQIKDEKTVVMIPKNSESSSKVFFIYIDYLDNEYKLTISDIEPNNKLIIYKATVPGGDTRQDLNSVTLTDVRKVINNNYIRSSEPFCTVALPGLPINNSDYGVYVVIDEATDSQRVGDVVVYDKQPNGFKMKITGDADNVKLRWTLINPNLK